MAASHLKANATWNFIALLFAGVLQDPAAAAAQYQSMTQTLRYAAHCYVQGIKLATAPLAVSGMKARNEEALQASVDLLPRLLHLLSFDDKEGEQQAGADGAPGTESSQQPVAAHVNASQRGCKWLSLS